MKPLVEPPSPPINWILIAWNNSYMLSYTNESDTPTLTILKPRKPGALLTRLEISFTMFYACLKFVSATRKANSRGQSIGKHLKSYRCTLSPSQSFRIFFLLEILAKKFPYLRPILTRIADLERLLALLPQPREDLQVLLVISGPGEMHKTLRSVFEGYSSLILA